MGHNTVRLPPHSFHDISRNTFQASAEPPWQQSDYGLARWQEMPAVAKPVVKVAVLDTGVAQNATEHVKPAHHKDFTGGVGIDRNGHGTFCANVLAGPLGCCPGHLIELYAGKVLGDDGSGSLDWVVQGVRWAVDSGCDILSISLGGPQGTDALRDALIAARDRNIMAFVAAGNGRRDGIDFPGRYTSVACIGAINRLKQIADFSDVGVDLDFVGPGVQVESLSPDGQRRRGSGTSFSTPWVAGQAALWLSCQRISRGDIAWRPAWSDFFLAITEACQDLGDAKHDLIYGWGVPLPERWMPAEFPNKPEPPRPPAPPPANPPPTGDTLRSGWVRAVAPRDKFAHDAKTGRYTIAPGSVSYFETTAVRGLAEELADG